MKKCAHCEQILPDSDFYSYYDKRRDKKRLWTYCRVCESKRAKQQKINFKKQCLQYKNQFSCVICGYNKNLNALDFHHTKSSEKDFNISSVKTININNEIKNELDKCDVVCANCHREIHSISDFEFNPKAFEPFAPSYCINCSKPCYKNCQYCKSCYQQTRRKNIPSKKQLADDINNLKHLTTIGKKYNVSGNAVKKWLKSYNLFDKYKNRH